MPDEKSFWTTVPGIITGLAAVVTAVTGLIVVLNGAGFSSKPAVTGKTTTETTKPVIKKNADSLSTKQAELQKPAENLKAVFSMTRVKIEDHEYTILGSSLEPVTPENNSLIITIKYKTIAIIHRLPSGTRASGWLLTDRFSPLPAI